MVKSKVIKTFSPERFREKYIGPGAAPESILKADYEKFFIVKVEDLIRRINLPVPPMRTTNHTIIYLTDGEAVMRIGNEKYMIFQHECLIVPAGQVFSFDHVDLNRGYLFNFQPDFLVRKFGTREWLRDLEFLQVWGNPRMQLDVPTSEAANQLLMRMYQVYSATGLENPDVLQAYTIAFFCEISSVYQPLTSGKQTAAVTITNQFRELLFASIKTQHRVTDYATQLNITPNHLNKSVKAVTGKSPTKWIDEALILEAKILLYQTDLTISEVAAEIGIYDASYFSRLFKKYEGATPLEFRKMIEIS